MRNPPYDPTPAKTEARRQIHLGQPQQAAAALHDVLAQYPGDAEAHALMGAAIAQSGDQTASVPYFEQAVRLDPRRASNHYNLGVAYERTGSPAWALEAYRHALEVDPYFIQAASAYYRLAPQWAPARYQAAPPVNQGQARQEPGFGVQGSGWSSRE